MSRDSFVDVAGRWTVIGIRWSARAWALAIAGIWAWFAPSSVAALEAGFAESDITPNVKGERPVWLAGYGMGRRATDVHDPLMARAVVLKDGDVRVALVSVDLVGLQYPEVRRIRQSLKGFSYVLVSSTHNHEGPDVIGIWGRSPIDRGVDPEYLDRVVGQVVTAVNDASRAVVEVEATYGTAEDEALVDDSRLPKVKDGVLRVLRFQTVTGKLAGVLVQWNCHPEAMGSRNTQVTADFCWSTVAALKQRYNCPVAYFTGTVGGLLAPPDHGIRDAQGNELRDGNFEYTERYGQEVAKLAERAIAAATPITLTPLEAFARPIAVPIDNKIYRAARSLGVLRRDAVEFTGDADQIGPALTAKESGKRLAIETEVAYLRLGDLHVACIPGEIYPELVTGRYQDPVEPNADFPDAPLEPHVASLMPGPKWMLFGLANDEIGYIIPKRQWDDVPPFAYGRDKSQYGEINSCSPEAAPIVLGALQRRVAESRRRPAAK